MSDLQSRQSGEVGRRIRTDLLRKEDRAAYGKRILAILSPELTQRYGKEAALGLILCAGKNREAVKLLVLEKSGIHVVEYLTALPPRKALERKLHEVVASARARLLQKGDEDLWT